MSAQHHDVDTLRAAALTTARLQGCDCTPDVDIAEQGDGMYRADIGHDDCCHLMQRRRAPWN